ncbi:MAG: HAMP domain-containing histidine kinase [Planctomycetaceae bacterium]|nr:HAMP domain-containing histidine kinase [Planctomycetaceae bacterium]
MPWSRLSAVAFLCAVWSVFCLWQLTEHRHQCELIRNTLSSQALALSNAVSGSLQSHRWFGPYVQQQLPATLDVLARADSVISVVVLVNDDFDHQYAAGDTSQVDWTLSDGEHTSGDTLQLIRSFALQNNPPVYSGVLPEEELRPAVESFRSIVVLDRSSTIRQIHREGINRILIVILGTLLLGAAGAGWWFTVRLAQAEGRTRLLTAEARHLRELGQAAAGLAHETRNPLGLIRGWTQRLAETGLPQDDQQDQAEAILEECDRVTARINQFLSFARQSEVDPEPVDFCELMKELRTLLQSDLDDGQLTLTVNSPNGGMLILADRNQLRQVLFNLIQNAIAFAPRGTAVTVTLKRPSGVRLHATPEAAAGGSDRGDARIEVADSGPGVPEELVHSLFEPYVTRRPGGTGLGLSIVRRIAFAHDWDVGYNPGTDRGSVFFIDGIKTVRGALSLNHPAEL